MAAVEVTVSGILYDKIARTSQQVVLVGEGSLTGLGVGGGPIIPPGGGGGGGGEPPPVKPPVEWKAIWAGPEQGWVAVGVINPDIKHPTPSST